MPNATIPRQHEISVMSPTDGDYKVTWDPDSSDEIEAAREAFNKLRRKGMAAYSVDKDGEKKAIVHEFDPELSAMIMAPPVAGG